MTVTKPKDNHPYRSGERKEPTMSTMGGVMAGAQALDSMEDRLRTILSDVSGCDSDEVTLSASLRDDLMLDSLDLTEVFMRLAEQTGVELASDYDFDALKTFDDLLRLALNPPVESDGGAGGLMPPSGSDARGEPWE